MTEVLGGIIIALVAVAGFLWRALGKAREQARRNVPHREMRDLENDASVQDDTVLADRITRRGL